MKTQRFMLIMFILLLTSAQAGAATVNWNISGDGLWSESANWSPVKVPDSGDDVVINYGTGTITADTTAAIKTLTLGGSNKLTVSSTGKLTVSSAEPLKVFVTSVTGSSILSTWVDAGGQTGVAAGDNICQARATAAALSGTYKAWLSDNTTDAYCHIQGYTGKTSADCGQGSLPVAAGPWVRTDGNPFADTIDRLINNGEVFAPVKYDENGALAPAFNYFTGTNEDGTGSGQNGSEWTATTSTLMGVPSSTTITWTAGSGGAGQTCSLLCFQTGAGGPLPAITAPALSKKVFVTSVSGTGDLSSWADAGGHAGVAAGDAICVARATEASIPNAANFKAWLSTDTVNAKDRITSDGPWYRLDGVKVADSKAALLNTSTVPLFTSISYTDTDLYIGSPYAWSGTSAAGTAATYTCDNWTNDTTGSHGTWGVPSYTDGGWTDWYNSHCSETRTLYCFEDN